MDYGLYKIYVNGTLVKSDHSFGIDRPYAFIEAVDANANNLIEWGGLEQAVKDSIQSAGGGTVTHNNTPDDITLQANPSSSLLEFKPSYKTTLDNEWNSDARGIVQDSNKVTIAGQTRHIGTHIANNNIINVKDFGAVGDGVTDDTEAIQAALDYCTNTFGYTIYTGTLGSRATVYAQGKFAIDSTIVINCEVDMRRAEFVLPSTYADIAVKVEPVDSTKLLQLDNCFLPNITITSSSTWAYDNTGLRLTALYDSRIYFGDVWNFRKGVEVTTWNWHVCGCAYNDFHLGSIRNNKVGLHIFPADSGFTNENNWYGGKIRIDSGFPSYSGTVLLHLTGNNNNFYKLCIEGNSDSTKIWLDATNYDYGCAYNTFYNLRPEKGNGDWRLIADGAECLRNNFVNGYIDDFDDIDYVVNNSATSEAVSLTASRVEIRTGASTNGIKKYQNITSDGYPIISLYSLQLDPKVYPDSMSSKIWSTGFQFKSYYSYANPYLKADQVLKGLRFGNSSLDIDSAPYIITDYQSVTGFYLGLKGEPVMIGESLIIGNGQTTAIDSMTSDTDSVYFNIGTNHIALPLINGNK